MQIANVRLRLNKVGSDVPVTGCTPAEALVLHVLHQGNNGGSTFGDEMDKIDITGEAMTVTDKQKKVITKEAVPEKMVKGALVTPAQPQQLIKGKEITPAVPEQIVAAIPAKGVQGQPDFVAGVPEKRIAAVPAVHEHDTLITAKPAVYAPDVYHPAQEEEFKLEPILRSRTDAEELRRLKAKYGRCVTKKGDSIIGKIWPGMEAKLPQKFSDLDYSKLGFDGLEIASLDLATGKPVTKE